MQDVSDVASDTATDVAEDRGPQSDTGGLSDVIFSDVSDGGAGDATDGGAGDAGACRTFSGDYTPRVSRSSTDDWAPCVSDDNAYVRLNPSISSIARVEAFERMATDPTSGRAMSLFDPTRDPTAEEFTAARTVYLEPEGLDSRLVRRSDEHYPAPSSNDCRLEAVRTANPEYCVGPNTLVPRITAAFQGGQVGETGTPPRVFAARIEAAVLWFLYLSPYKESLSCTTTTADCDSSWAYYTGGAERDAATQLGLARRVRAVAPETHQRIWDALLAVRCWRDLDRSATAVNTALRDRARTQLDRALTRGIVEVFLARLRAMGATTGAEQRAHHAFVVALAPLLDRAVRAADAPAADLLRAQAALTNPAMLDVAALSAALDRAIPCP